MVIVQHAIEINFRKQEYSLTLLDSFQNKWRKKAEKAGNIRNKRDNTCTGNIDTVHSKEAGVENTGNKDVIKRSRKIAAQGYKSSFCFVVFGAVDFF